MRSIIAIFVFASLFIGTADASPVTDKVQLLKECSPSINSYETVLVGDWYHGDNTTRGAAIGLTRNVRGEQILHHASSVGDSPAECHGNLMVSQGTKHLMVLRKFDDTIGISIVVDIGNGRASYTNTYDHVHDVVGTFRVVHSRD